MEHIDGIGDVARSDDEARSIDVGVAVDGVGELADGLPATGSGQSTLIGIESSTSTLCGFPNMSCTPAAVTNDHLVISARVGLALGFDAMARKSVTTHPQRSGHRVSTRSRSHHGYGTDVCHKVSPCEAEQRSIAMCPGNRPKSAVM